LTFAAFGEHRLRGTFNVMNYQLAFATPGINPFDANSRKHMRQISKRLINPLERPHTLQRTYRRVLNFFGLIALTIWLVFAITF
jgi:hypothetical protein